MGHVNWGDLPVRLWFLILFSASLWGQSFVVVTHRDSPITSISKDQLRGIFMGQISRLDGHEVKAIHLRGDEALKKTFEAYLFGPHFNFDQYALTQKLQTGKDIVFFVRNRVLAMAYVERNPGFIAFVGEEQRSTLKNHNLVECEITE